MGPESRVAVGAARDVVVDDSVFAVWAAHTAIGTATKEEKA